VNVFESARLGPTLLRNRIIKAATFEGRSPEGAVTDALVDFHRAVAAGGAAMSTLAFCAVAPEGRTHREQIVMAPDALDGLRTLTDAIHAEGAAAAIQIGHAGPVANAASNGTPAIAPTRSFSPLAFRFNRQATAADLARIVTQFADAARIAVEAGFDCVELHFGHSYLPSSFLSPRLNRRRDAWGDGIEGRARFPRDIARAVRDATGGKVAIIAKFNMTDGVSGGLSLADALATARLLEADASLDALALTGGSSLANPMFLFRGEAPVQEFAATLPWHLRLPFRFIGRKFMREYPFEEAYFLPMARKFLAEMKLPLILLGGINRFDTVERALDEGFPFVAMARALLREPDLINRFRADPDHRGRCVHCNRCMPTIYAGAHCPLNT
jgi:2,4-dienoyl-CoA reductase-like NADH-dependent reductase (Old Yellow Enzyme family)